MTPAEIYRALAVDPARAARLRGRLREGAPPDWCSLAAALACLPTPDGVLGISGGQGAGKSTLAALIEQALAFEGRRTLVLSLDDFYLRRAERAVLARDVHPLLATRGVPGTHDVARLAETIVAARTPAALELPVFDKGQDDRMPEPKRVRGPFDVVVLEGWCVGARPEPDTALARPCNALEAELDPDGTWRRYVNACLATTYAGVWVELDRLLFLAVPDLDAVRSWRGQQENERPPDRRMTRVAIERFVAHYERLTRWMLEDLTLRADIVGYLDRGHGLARVSRHP